ncbi:type 1 glutamine amidotransferase [Arenibacter sp. ARW7G5Y1]|uniref:type 1 glutamine amidotransferase n=1 Tax=Arenibacter sp. ARW7G5Y1 TaxID=2135619 RepID=UPI000D757A19|nr:type 1 glutamine amidotransferase [Arenibacter sp. ARW7G5Y1]PXX26022.1 GMP synthase (glutamine-hydrolysing) [Arenibacter sp. ARW7G5Y1]
MRLLIVEGNKEQTRLERGAFGIKPYHLMFQEMLGGLVPKAQTDFAFPADVASELPTAGQIKKYDGVLWTGSSLSVLDESPDVEQQLNFAEEVFKSGVPFYGSCWGMQVATVVAGGKVALSKNGLEFGISKPIDLTPLGRQNPLTSHRKGTYSALCIHFDEVTKVPENALILAGNAHSKVQAMTFDYKKGSFFGVQYHPEFSSSDMALIGSFLAEKLVKSDAFNSLEEVQEFCLSLREQKGIPPEISDYQLHTQEIMAWLKLIAGKQ